MFKDERPARLPALVRAEGRLSCLPVVVMLHGFDIVAYVPQPDPASGRPVSRHCAALSWLQTERDARPTQSSPIRWSLHRRHGWPARTAAPLSATACRTRKRLSCEWAMQPLFRKDRGPQNNHLFLTGVDPGLCSVTTLRYNGSLARLGGSPRKDKSRLPCSPSKTQPSSQRPVRVCAVDHYLVCSRQARHY